MKKLFLISQSVNDDYDTYDSAVVVAKSERDALKIHPSKFTRYTDSGEWSIEASWEWVPFKDAISGAVSVKCIGVADNSLNEGDVICASFNAG